jgi:cytochrome P450
MDPLDLINALLSDEGRDDPYPLYAELRKHGSLITVQPDYLVATSYQAVDAVLRDARLGVQDASLLLLERSMLNTNPPDHPRMRRLVSGAFTPKRIAELEYAITTQAQRLAAQMLEKGGIRDLMEEFAYRLPVAVICELLGIPERDREWFRPVASDFAVVLEGTMTELEMSAALSAAELLQAYFTDLVRTRRGTQTMIGEMADSDALTHAELLGNLALLLLAGFETTTNLIGNGLMALLQRPADLARLRDDPGLAPSYVEEFLRYDSPVQATSRIAMSDTVVNGEPIAPGAFVMALIGSANRDPVRFSEADEFRPERPGNGSISFGAGAHFCLGAALARLEVRIAFPLLLSTFPGLELGGEPIRKQRLVLRGYQSLPIAWA